ncbi:hypothetical protein LTR91_008505 [Friedmanniomyces endolithicus]|uniref:DUF8035 domain-containing protein n=2 Tax=Dothideomycetidae TaxID=451867 RepID=A0AAN6KN80_9PEZI|nr:hypothetical protein LTR94_009476 [Friedmanniomyces endolithicus]KAK0798449.1 hypothetical protein LTR59_006454 [Friedmanniomyces endolithicus]KAK0804369.1 hypothetical protein LTR75_007684 [Friedmanniomyces endolithicus]KAK0811301.1 hypothetical protein LTR38_003629 [Friedmanniomyces endolithicus]KAK0845167.1 hypothetical protein LTR03_007665 [Friedmanniomyces endolithicus]
MSRRGYDDRYDDRESGVSRRPRRDREYEELDVDITRTRGYPESRAPRGETLVKERDTVINERRGERGPRQPDFLRDDYGKTTSGALVIRREERDEDTYSRAPTRRRSLETVRSRAPTERVVEKEEIVIRERDRDRAPQYPRGERDFTEKEEIIIREGGRERARSRPPREQERSEEEIDIKIKRQESRPEPPRSEAPARSEYRERDIEEVRFRRGGGEMPARPPPARTEVDREEIRFTETRSPPPRSDPRGREVIREEIDIREERSMPPPRREPSRGQLVARDREEWIVRRKREVSPPPPRDYEKEEIIIRRRERTPSPEPPPREPTPEPAPPPPLEPIIRPPIIQEVITHHRHIDHGIERARSPTPPPAPAPPSPPREEALEIEIKRQGVRNGRAYEEDIIFERDIGESRNKEREYDRETTRRRSPSPAPTRRRSPSPAPSRAMSRRYEQDDIAQEAEYYNRKVRERGYAGEAYNGATRDWGLVDVPPGTERVRMDGAGGGAQEIFWDRYKGERRGKFITADRTYGEEWGNGGREREPARSPPPEKEKEKEKDRETVRETRITRDRIIEDTSRGKTKDKMWTEITKDLVLKEAVDEMGYEYEETDEFFYVMEYLRYEDVLHLVELTEDIRRERRERIREIQWQREESERLPAPKMITAPPPLPSIPPPPMSVRGGGRWDEKVYERDYVYERDGRRYR